MTTEYLNVWGTNVIKEIQTSWTGHENLLSTVSHVGDPSYVFGVLFPIVSTVNSVLAADLLFVSVAAEWSSVVLKWLLMEDRPFWWLRETDIYGKKRPHVFQTRASCETSPGSPSGHVAVCAALLYVLARGLHKSFGRIKRVAGRGLLIASVWALYTIAIALVSTSRMYDATHFPHQCLLGAALGFCIGYCFGDSDCIITRYWHNSTRLRCISWILTFTFITIGCYWMQKALGIDPQWSTKMAFKWCDHYENLSVNTTPMFSLARDLGLALGICSISPLMARVRVGRHVMVSAACVLAYCTALRMAQTAVPTDDALLFYSCHALLYSTVPYILIGVVPKIAVTKPKTQ